MIGRHVGRYLLVSELGSGGMGVVYKARDERLKRHVALKVLREGELAGHDAVARFEREAVALSRLRHPNVAHCYDVGHDGGLHYLVMELVVGTALDQRDRLEPMAIDRLEDLAEQLLLGIQALHAAGLAHRDLKPANLILGRDGRLRIVDLGLASDVGPTDDDGPTRSYTRHAGSLPYMSPEQLRGDPPTTATDLWAAGVVLYELATGERPYEARSVFDLVTALREPPPRPASHRPDLPAALDSLVVDCLGQDPRSRPTASEALERLHDDSAGQAEPRPSRLAQFQVWRAGTVVALLLVVALASLAIQRWLEARSAPDSTSSELVARQILTTGPSKEDAHWSPEGDWISWIEAAGRSHRLRVSRPEGGEGVELVPATQRILSHEWGPRGKQIAYLTIRDDLVSLEIIPAPLGGFPTLRHRLPQQFQRIVSWSGDRLFLESRDSSLWVLDISTKSLTQVLAPEGFDYVRDWDVSSDARSVLFSGQVDGVEDLWTADLSGSRQRQLTDDPYRDFSGRFLDAPGTRIALVSSRGGPTGVWTLDVPTGELRALPTAAPVVRISDAGASGLLASSQSAHTDVWRRAADGSCTLLIGEARQDLQITAADSGRFVVQRVAEERDRPSLIEESMLVGFESLDPGSPRVLVDRGFQPAISPSGRRLAYSTVSAGEFAVRLLDLETLDSTSLSTSAFYLGRKSFPFAYMPPVTPRWTPAGSLDFAVLLADGRQSVRRLEADTQNALYTTPPGGFLRSFVADDTGRVAVVLSMPGIVAHRLEIWEGGDLALRARLPDARERRLLGWYGDRLLAAEEVTAFGEQTTRIVDALEGADAFTIDVPGGVVATALPRLDRHRITLTAERDGAASVVRVDLRRLIVETIVPAVAGEATFCCFAEVNDDLLYVAESRSRGVWAFEAERGEFH